MYIVSTHKDYYDTALSQGVDMRTVFIRNKSESSCNSKELFDEQYKFPFTAEFKTNTFSATLKTRIIGFCGKFYPVVNIERRTYCGPYAPTLVEQFYYYSIEEIKESVYSTILQNICNEWWRNEITIENRLNQIFSISGSEVHERFRSYPVFTIRPLVKPEHTELIYNSKGHDLLLTINDELKSYNFMKRFDAYSAFQEIAMYISGVIGSPCNPMVEVADKYKVVGKGFDPIYGFRKRPSNDR